MTSRSAQIVQNYLKKAPVKQVCPHKLTDLEMQILKRVCDGLTSTEIAEKIHKSSRTVEKYISDIYKKFNVPNKAQLIKMVSQWELEDR